LKYFIFAIITKIDGLETRINTRKTLLSKELKNLSSLKKRVVGVAIRILPAKY